MALENTHTEHNIDTLISEIEKEQHTKHRNRTALFLFIGISIITLTFIPIDYDESVEPSIQSISYPTEEKLEKEKIPEPIKDITEEQAESEIEIEEDGLMEKSEAYTVNKQDFAKTIHQPELIHKIEDVALKVSGVREAQERLTFTIVNFNPNFDYFMQFGNNGKLNPLKASKFSHRFSKKGSYDIIVSASPKRMNGSQVKELYRERIYIMDEIEIASGAEQVDYR